MILFQMLAFTSEKDVETVDGFEVGDLARGSYHSSQCERNRQYYSKTQKRWGCAGPVQKVLVCSFWTPHPLCF